jgi:hypothetical protein
MLRSTPIEVVVADARQAFFVCRGDTWRLLAF